MSTVLRSVFMQGCPYSGVLLHVSAVAVTNKLKHMKQEDFGPCTDAATGSRQNVMQGVGHTANHGTTQSHQHGQFN